MRSSIAAGLIAGAIAGIVPMILTHTYMAIGIQEPYPFPITIIFLVNQAIVHLGWNGLWGAIFGLFIALFFDRIPGKGIKKGLLIGLIYSLFSSWQPAYSFWTYGHTLAGIAFILNSAQDKFVCGILFAYLYKKPTEAIAVKKEKTRTFKIKNCEHCGASIKKGSKFCNECGKKQ